MCTDSMQDVGKNEKILNLTQDELKNLFFESESNEFFCSPSLSFSPSRSFLNIHSRCVPESKLFFFFFFLRYECFSSQKTSLHFAVFFLFLNRYILLWDFKQILILTIVIWENFFLAPYLKRAQHWCLMKKALNRYLYKN